MRMISNASQHSCNVRAMVSGRSDPGEAPRRSAAPESAGGYFDAGGNTWQVPVLTTQCTAISTRCLQNPSSSAFGTNRKKGEEEAGRCLNRTEFGKGLRSRPGTRKGSQPTVINQPCLKEVHHELRTQPCRVDRPYRRRCHRQSHRWRRPYCGTPGRVSDPCRTRCLAHWSAGRPAYLSHQTFLPEM